MSGTPHRTVGPFIQLFRRLVRGRKDSSVLRFPDELAARTQPPPKIPGGPYHRTSKIYYHTRDARRLVTPPIEIEMSQHKQITAGSSVQPTERKPVIPHAPYHPPYDMEPPKGKVVDEKFEL